MKTVILTLSLAVVVGLAAPAGGALVDNLNGTVTQTRNDGSRLTWTKNAAPFGCQNCSDAQSLIDDFNANNFVNLGHTGLAAAPKPSC